MSVERFLNDRVTLHCGDCLAVLPTLAENSIDSVVCDPPYHLTRIVKRFGVYKRASGGFMGKQWDGGDIAFQVETWAAVYRVLKPGAHLIAFSGTRTYHRMACAIEDAGFEIRDQGAWCYGSGFPKSHNISKAIDRAAGAKRDVVGRKSDPRYLWPANAASGSPMGNISPRVNGRINYERAGFVTAPATDNAAEWEGWGTALKPAWEPICLARKPLSEPTIAANVLRWGTGALNIDACRIEWVGFAESRARGMATQSNSIGKESRDGRWPANLIHDGSEEVIAAYNNGVYGALNYIVNDPEPRGDKGSAARFFYTSKADSNDRLGSKHPTVKPLDLIQYLCRLVTPPRGTVLDLFAGTGTTGEAAWREGFSAVLIEREAEYQADIRRRMALALAGPDERARESIKERMKDKPVDAGPLFGGESKDERGGGRSIYGVFADERLARSD